MGAFYFILHSRLWNNLSTLIWFSRCGHAVLMSRALSSGCPRSAWNCSVRSRAIVFLCHHYSHCHRQYCLNAHWERIAPQARRLALVRSDWYPTLRCPKAAEQHRRTYSTDQMCLGVRICRVAFSSFFKQLLPPQCWLLQLLTVNSFEEKGSACGAILNSKWNESHSAERVLFTKAEGKDSFPFIFFWSQVPQI